MSAGQRAASRAAQPQDRRHRGGWREDGTALTTLLVLLVAITGAGLYWTPKPTTRRHLAATASQLKSELLQDSPRPIGTTGTGGGGSPRATDAELPSSAVIRDIETITGSIDGHELMGRRVDLYVPVIARAGNIGYWVGPRDNRVLVVDAEANGGVTGKTARTSSHDVATGATPAAAAVAPIADGQRVRVAGIIKPLPPDAAAQWPLPDADRSVLADRTIFIRAN